VSIDGRIVDPSPGGCLLALRDALTVREREDRGAGSVPGARRREARARGRHLPIPSLPGNHATTRAVRQPPRPRTAGDAPLQGRRPGEEDGRARDARSACEGHPEFDSKFDW